MRAWPLALALSGCAVLAPLPVYHQPTAGDLVACQALAKSRGLTLAQFAGRMVVLNAVNSLWALQLFSAVGVQCGCTLVRCDLNTT